MSGAGAQRAESRVEEEKEEEVPTVPGLLGGDDGLASEDEVLLGGSASGCASPDSAMASQTQPGLPAGRAVRSLSPDRRIAHRHDLNSPIVSPPAALRDEGAADAVRGAAPKARAFRGRQRRERGGLRADREIAAMQQATASLLPRAPFVAVVRGLAGGRGHGDIQFHEGAPGAFRMRGGGEAYIVGLFEDAASAAAHGRRVTLQVRDLQLAMRLSGRY